MDGEIFLLNYIWLVEQLLRLLSICGAASASAEGGGMSYRFAKYRRNQSQNYK